jgi:hypothetical protein
MIKIIHTLILGLPILFLAGCESTGEGGGNAAVYYGVGFYDPWYYGDYHDDDIIVTPPGGDRPDRGPRPSQPIANPPSFSPGPSTMPSIPSMPRAAPRGGRR